jgi:hypothetical protein
MPSHMLGKVALSLGLRRAFPGIIPVDLDLDDDFIPVEDHRPIDAGAGSDREHVPENTPATAPAMLQGAGDVEPQTRPAADGLLSRLNALPQDQIRFFTAWRRSRALRWPPETAEELAEMLAQLEVLERATAAEKDTYGEEGGY